MGCGLLGRGEEKGEEGMVREMEEESKGQSRREGKKGLRRNRTGWRERVRRKMRKVGGRRSWVKRSR